MDAPRTFSLVSETLGALPIVNNVIDSIDLEKVLEEYVACNDKRYKLPPARALGVALRNILMGRSPLYGLDDWASAFAPEELGLDSDQARLLNDDRIGRALDRLFDADRASLMTAIVVRAVKAYEIELDSFHNDSTSITFSGGYKDADGRMIRGQRAARITHGKNKDHRPDLKQLLWVLTVSADGSTPVHYRVYSGNTSDDPTHIETWETLKEIAGGSDFLYIADSKLCSRSNMDHIARRGGRFICVMPRSRKEDKQFRDYVQDKTPDWEEIVRRPHPRNKAWGEDVWRVAEAPFPSGDGYRIVWFWSLSLAEKQLKTRVNNIQRAHDQLSKLNTRLAGKKCRLRSRGAVDEAAMKILDDTRARRWMEVTIHEESEHDFKQQGRGRPTADTNYKRVTKVRFQVEGVVKHSLVRYDAKSDGMYPVITNCRDMSGAELLAHHKQQPRLEKRHEQLKTEFGVAPMFLKNEGRVEALLFLYFVALLIQALIERQLRKGMDAQGLPSIPIYHEKRKCIAPTASRIFDVFASLQRHRLMNGAEVQQVFQPQLSKLQTQIIDLLGMTKNAYLSEK